MAGYGVDGEDIYDMHQWSGLYHPCLVESRGFWQVERQIAYSKRIL